MTNNERRDLRQHLINYLKETFGALLLLVNEPQGVQTGERVLYKLKEGVQAKRHEPTQQELAETKRKFVEIVKSTGADESRITFESPVSSGLSYPRLIDLPGSQIMWDKDLTKYLESDDPLPSPEFPLEWVLGVLFMPSEKMLLHLDFTHPKVKTFFRASYDIGDAPRLAERTEIRARFRQFWEKAGELKAQVENRDDILWAKLIQIDAEPQQIRLRSE
ncbi:MAG TPA: hypothetical protein VKW09_08890 [bacterium]|nr:hypothetical protein [bacterium]